jgi:hypothetical protein
MKPGGKRTEYVICRRVHSNTASTLDKNPNATYWVEVGRTHATSAKAAIQACFNGDGLYTAVPARSWKPEMVQSKQRAFLAFGTEGAIADQMPPEGEVFTESSTAATKPEPKS